MTPTEYEKHLQDARDTLLRSQNYMSLFVEVRATPSEIQNRYLGVFSNIESALRLMSLVQLAPLFDSDPKSAGLPTLLRVVARDSSTLASHADVAELRATRKTLNAHPEARQRLKNVRDRRLSHHDLNAVTDPITKGDYDALVGDAESVIKDLYWHYGRIGYTRAPLDQLTLDHWSEILKLIDP